LMGEVFVFIKATFLSSRLVNCATAGLNEGKKLSGEAPSPGSRPRFLHVLSKISPPWQERKLRCRWLSSINAVTFSPAAQRTLTVAAVRVSTFGIRVLKTETRRA